MNPALYARTDAICSVTVAVLDRRPVFSDSAVAEAAVVVLRAHAGRTAVPVYGYCVMPDHVHLVLAASETCNIITFVGQFKNLALRAAWALGVQGTFWQKSFWDHFLRADEQVEHVVSYVINNPVRASLVSCWREYPFAGSLVFSFDDIDSGGGGPLLREGRRAPALRNTNEPA